MTGRCFMRSSGPGRAHGHYSPVAGGFAALLELLVPQHLKVETREEPSAHRTRLPPSPHQSLPGPTRRWRRGRRSGPAGTEGGEATVLRRRRRRAGGAPGSPRLRWATTTTSPSPFPSPSPQGPARAPRRSRSCPAARGRSARCARGRPL